MRMFCYQCEQTAAGKGCTAAGVCGKSPEVAALQDLIIYALKDMARYRCRTRALGVVDQGQDRFLAEALFATVTNVSFDPERLADWVRGAFACRDASRQQYFDACEQLGRQPESLSQSAFETVAETVGGMVEQGRRVGLADRIKTLGEDVAGLQELLVYGLKGTAAYVCHARELGRQDDSLDLFLARALDALASGQREVWELLALCLECGQANLRAMEILHEAHVTAYGIPEPTEVRITPVPGKAILVSGHDLADLAELLRQTEGTGIHVYTHGEMLPAHGYPGLKRYPHLVGNFGGAWQEQRHEFDRFPGPILMTTNCIQEPAPSYRDRLFTAGLVSWPGVRHVEDRDYSPLIAAAQALPGFTEPQSAQTVTVGYGHQAILSHADELVATVKAGEIRHFFLVGGCDGAKLGRNYYTELVEQIPADCVILTLACGKYRFNRLDLGTLDGLPRLLDMGQCNDAYSAVQVVLALAEAFGCDANQLPLSLVLSWYEQKAVSILLTLLYLGIENIRLGPSLPAFLTPAIRHILAERFGLRATRTAEEDLAAMLGPRKSC